MFAYPTDLVRHPPVAIAIDRSVLTRAVPLIGGIIEYVRCDGWRVVVTLLGREWMWGWFPPVYNLAAIEVAAVMNGVRWAEDLREHHRARGTDPPRDWAGSHAEALAWATITWPGAGHEITEFAAQHRLRRARDRWRDLVTRPSATLANGRAT